MWPTISWRGTQTSKVNLSEYWIFTYGKYAISLKKRSTQKSREETTAKGNHVSKIRRTIIEDTYVNTTSKQYKNRQGQCLRSTKDRRDSSQTVELCPLDSHWLSLWTFGISSGCNDFNQLTFIGCPFTGYKEWYCPRHPSGLHDWALCGH